MQTYHEEIQIKHSHIHNLLDSHKVDGLLLRRVSSFAWGTCGAASYINTAVTQGAAALMFTRTHRYLITNNIEAPRLQQESDLTEQDWEYVISPWTDPLKGLFDLVSGKNIAADHAFPGAKEVSTDVSRLRSSLTAMEGERFRKLGNLCAEAMHLALKAIQPGMSEHQIAGLLSWETEQRGIQPIVNLIAVDDRINRFRHPLPTAKILEKYAMLVLCGRKWGLVCSLTRLIHFGQITEEIQERILATAQVNAAMIEATRPGCSLGELFKKGQQAYARVGFPDEWQKHHQGGIAGYEPREFLAVPGSPEIVQEGQVLAWNPSISGAKVEDTILVGSTENDVITLTPGLPSTSIKGIPNGLVWEIV